MTDKNIKFHSTGQFRNVVKNIQTATRYVGFDEETQKPIFDLTKKLPTISYIGTTKLHGTNASIILHEDLSITFHSKNNILGKLDEFNNFELYNDNAEFAQSMVRRLETVSQVIDRAYKVVKECYGEVKFPLKISGEWCGQGIQKGVGISYLPTKSFFIFGIKSGDTNQDDKSGWLNTKLCSKLTCEDTHSKGIYAITDFPYKTITIDFNNPEDSQNDLVKYTEDVEDCCPVAKALNLKDAEGTPQLLGEGLVWVPQSQDYYFDSGNWFKTKGKKHSVSKVKSVAAVCPEKLKNIKDFVEYAVTNNRLQQGINEIGLDQKSIRAYIGWVNQDINKEEGDTLEESNLTMKEVGSKISTVAREFYINKLNNNF